MGCRLCGSERLVSKSVGVCVDCLRRDPARSLEIVWSLRRRWRESIGFSPGPPRGGGGPRCSLCINECILARGSRGYCGVWVHSEDGLRPLGGRGRVLAHIYLDPIPTNCVAAHICPASTGRGYPLYAYREDIETGFYNLAVFLAGCPLDCVFCQNWEHKTAIAHGSIDTSVVRPLDPEYLVSRAMDPRVSCICYFGGDPTPHTPLLIQVSRRILEVAREKRVIKRICWETNGLVNPLLMREMARLSLVSGGIVKIDWKAWTPSVYEALTGVDGEKAVKRVMENIRVVAEMSRERPEIPLLVVSILLVPGYVDSREVEGMAEYISSIDRDIPVVLLAFHPDHLMRDLPPTSIRHAYEALEIMKRHGIREVFIGNIWLLGDYY